MKTVCLNMIVRDESRAIQRCLASVRPLIQYWVIVDTGSVDGTQELVREALKGIPGELYERPWVDFATNRNEAMRLAKGKGDYLLFIDADERLEIKEPFHCSFDRDLYYIVVHTHKTFYQRVFLVDARLDWSYRGVLHEQFSPLEGRSSEVIQEVVNISVTEDGARGRDPQKYLKDAQILEEGLKKEPENLEYLFYLAQSYVNAGFLEKALEIYGKRAMMGGCPQCVYYSLYIVAVLRDLAFHEAPEIVIESYKRAYASRPTRAEPLYRLAEFYLKQGELAQAQEVIRKGLSIPMTTDGLNVEGWIYELGFKKLAHETNLS